MKFSDVLFESEDIEKLSDEIVSASPTVQDFFFKQLQKIYNTISKSGKVVKIGIS
jgi:hypothetical protein